MSERVQVEISVEPETAAILSDYHRRAAIGRLVDQLVRRGAEDPLMAAFAASAAEARASGLTEEDVERELAVYNSERRG